MRCNDVAGVCVRSAKMLHCNLGARAFVWPVEMECLGIGCKSPTDHFPDDFIKHQLSTRSEIDNLIVDEFNLGIDIARREFREVAYLRDWRAIGEHPKDVPIHMAALLPFNAGTDGICVKTGFAFPSLHPFGGLARLSVEVRVSLS